MLAFRVVVLAGGIGFLMWARWNAKRPPMQAQKRPTQYHFNTD
jgi:hypothetical protein